MSKKIYQVVIYKSISDEEKLVSEFKFDPNNIKPKKRNINKLNFFIVYILKSILQKFS